jgi:hypothetical protein
MYVDKLANVHWWRIVDVPVALERDSVCEKERESVCFTWYCWKTNLQTHLFNQEKERTSVWEREGGKERERVCVCVLCVWQRVGVWKNKWGPPFLSYDATKRVISAVLIACIVIWPRPVLSVDYMVQEPVPVRSWERYSIGWVWGERECVCVIDWVSKPKPREWQEGGN